MAGTKNDTLIGKNADFSQAGAPNATSGEANGLATDGQMWIGSTATNVGGTHINVGTLTSSDASVSIAYSSPNIDLSAGGTVPLQFTGNSGIAIPAANNLNVQGVAGATNISNSPVTTTGSTDNLILNWNNVLPPTVIGTGAVNLTFQDYGVIYSSPGGGTVNLPQIGTSGIYNGKMFFVKDTGNASANNITINAFAGDNINGASSFVLNKDYQSVTLMYGTGSTWILTNSFTPDVSLADGGTNASLTASDGGLFYSTATAGAILAGTATAGQIPRSGANSAPSWSTATYPATTTANQILYSNATNTITGLATANSGVLTTDSSGVPSIDTTNFVRQTTGMQMKGNNTNTAPPAGFIGERIESTGTSVAMTSTVSKTVCSISLTAGVWDVSAIATVFATGGTTLAQAFVVNISTTNNTVVGTAGIQTFQSNFAGTVLSGSVPALRVLLSSTTTYYLVCTVFYTSTTAPTTGRLSATRVG